ncbi:MAG TPA: hypothetical protein VH250_11485 [Granulicella sp.]|nr:hypothetical protein [Granulicella sp.]
MNVIKDLSSVSLLAVSLMIGLVVGGFSPQAQAAQTPRPATDIVVEAVRAELAADQNDHSRWRYRDEQKQQDDSVSIVVQTDNGAVRRLIAKGGHPLTPAEAQAENNRIHNFIQDPSALAKQRRDGAQDDKSARDLLNMLPTAFLWRVESEDADTIHLHFEPNPGFDPPSLQARVLGAMNGELVVDKSQHRIETISGRLTHDVTFGFGFLGRLHAGGTFRVERREVASNLWQITETHVHIDGRALFFKNISQQQDEIQTDFTQVPPNTTLEKAAQMTNPEPPTAPEPVALPASHAHRK